MQGGDVWVLERSPVSCSGEGGSRLTIEDGSKMRWTVTETYAASNVENMKHRTRGGCGGPASGGGEVPWGDLRAVATEPRGVVV